MKVVLTGGGTGGHIYPALAVGEAIIAHMPGAGIHFVGGISGPETAIVPAAGVPFKAVAAKKLVKIASISTLGVILALLRGYGQAWRFLREYRPNMVVGTGGYVAAA